jgi:hypothetical protein
VATADRIVIEKSAHTMTLMCSGQVLKTYKGALGNPVGTNGQEGDRETPEGAYVIDSKNPHSRFHRALHISYSQQKLSRFSDGSVRWTLPLISRLGAEAKRSCWPSWGGGRRERGDGLGRGDGGRADEKYGLVAIRRTV